MRTLKPARSSTPTSNLEADNGNKRSTILFAPNASDPSVSALQSVKSLAGDLSASLGDGNSRVQLLAYGGERGDKSSDSRRLSLKRALIVRQILIDSGVPSERIDVRAMGGVDDSGPLDRVDVFLKS
jgi:outer membrane protein OmpA-like peptidoglycan-associated protein